MNRIAYNFGEPVYEEYIDKIGYCKFFVDELTGPIPHFVVEDVDHGMFYSICLLEELYYSKEYVFDNFTMYDQKESLHSFLNQPGEYVHSKFRLVSTKWKVLLNRWVENNTGKVYELKQLLDLIPQPDYRHLIYEKDKEEDIYPLDEAWDIISGTNAEIDKELLYSLHGGYATVSAIVAIINGGNSIDQDHGSIIDVDDYTEIIPEPEPEPEPEEPEDEGKILTNLLDDGVYEKDLDEITTTRHYTVVNGGNENYHVVASLYTTIISNNSSTSFISVSTESSVVTHETLTTNYSRTIHSTSRYFNYYTGTIPVTSTYTTYTNSEGSTDTYSITSSSSNIFTTNFASLKTLSELWRTRYSMTDSIPIYTTITHRQYTTQTSSWTSLSNGSCFTSSYVGISTTGSSYYRAYSTFTRTNTLSATTTKQAGSSTAMVTTSYTQSNTTRETTKYSRPYTYNYIPHLSTSTTFTVENTSDESGESTLSSSGFFTYMNNTPYTSSQTYNVTRTNIYTLTHTTAFTITDASSSTIMNSTYSITSSDTFTTNAANTYKISDTFSSSRTTMSTLTLSSITSTMSDTITSLRTSTSSTMTIRNLYSTVIGDNTYYYTASTERISLVFTNVRYLTTYTSYFETLTASSLITSDDHVMTYSTTALSTTSGATYSFFSSTRTTITEFRHTVTQTGSVYTSSALLTIAVKYTSSSRFTETALATSLVNSSSSYATYSYTITNMTNTSTISYNNIATVSYGNIPYSTTTAKYSTYTTRYY